MPSIPGLPLLAFTRRNACWQFSRSQTSSINCSSLAGLSVSHFAVNDSVPSRRAFGASLLPSSVKASAICSWFFCRLSLIESCVLLAAPYCLGLRPCGLLCPLLTPAATVKMNRSILSHDSVTCGRSPEVSSTAFHAQPPDLPPVPLMDMGFAVTCQLARHRMPHIRFLFIGSHLCSTLLSDPASRRRPCASLSLHLHQVGKGTFTPKLSNMLGTHRKGATARAVPPSQYVYSVLVRSQRLALY